MQIICSRDFLDPNRSMTDKEFYKQLTEYNDNNRIKFLVLE